MFISPVAIYGNTSRPSAAWRKQLVGTEPNVNRRKEGCKLSRLGWAHLCCIVRARTHCLHPPGTLGFTPHSTCIPVPEAAPERTVVRSDRLDKGPFIRSRANRTFARPTDEHPWAQLSSAPSGELAS